MEGGVSLTDGGENDFGGEIWGFIAAFGPGSEIREEDMINIYEELLDVNVLRAAENGISDHYLVEGVLKVNKGGGC